MIRLLRYPTLVSMLAVALALCGGLGLDGGLRAQPAAPTFECIRADTLFWTEPTDACGALGSIDVFGAPAAGGPYSLLGNVPAGTGPFYALTSAQAIANRYYYLVARYPTCSPDASQPSVTLDTEPLLVPRIERIDYTPTGTRIRWTVPDDPRITRFLIYKETPLGTTLLDTVAGTQYFDAGTQVELAPAAYYLGSLNACNSSSFSAEAFSSAVVVVDRDPCAGEVRIRRRLATPWPRDFVRAELTRERVDGPTDVLVLGADSVLVVPDVAPDSAYTLRVVYFDAEGGATAAFPVDLGAQAFVADDIIEIAQVTFEAGSWGLRWRWDTRAAYSGTEFIVRRGGEVVRQESTDPDFDILPAPVVDLGLDATFDWSDATVVVRSTDGCGVVRESAPARPAVVTARELGPFAVATAWTLPQAPPATNVAWTLRFSDGTTGTRLLLTTADSTAFLHDVRAVNSREVCYTLVTDVTLPAVFNRGEARFAWRTAPTCVVRQPRVYLPTGFVPEGYTIEYRPRLSLTEGLTYRLEVYDRWGKRVFESDDPFVGWSGTDDTNAGAPTGVYLAVVTLEESGREPIRVEQAFTVVR